MRQTFDLLRKHIRPGITTAELDAIAEEFILSKDAETIYKGYAPASRRGPPLPPFPATICASVNDVICHGIPSTRQRLRQGDIVGIDIGLRYKGWVGDACVTFPVGDIDDASHRLLEATQHCLALAIQEARVGKTLGDIGAAIQGYAEPNGFSVVREYTGHGLGRTLHEDPTVYHFGEPNTGRKILTGMVFTIEPMINLGKAETRVDKDRWTVRTADGSRSAQFEHTLAITDSGPIILTA